MNSCLTELHYLPSIQYFSLFYSHINVTLEKHEHYQKGSYRNRCYIGSSAGPLMLSVPLVKGKHQQLPITQVQIAYHTPWYAQHCHAIQTAYGKSPYFIHYADAIRDILYQKYEKLWDLNRAMLGFLKSALNAPARVRLTGTYEQMTEEIVVDLRNTINPGKEFHMKSYEQVFSDRIPFQSNLSALDLLMHMGPSGSEYLRELATT